MTRSYKSYPGDLKDFDYIILISGTIEFYNGKLTIVVEINYYKLISSNRFFNKSDCVTLKRNKFRTSLL